VAQKGLSVNFNYLTPKGTFLHETTSFEPSRVKIRWRVWPVV